MFILLKEKKREDMSWFIVDVEADGKAPGLYSMVSFGAIRVDRELDTTFYGETRPISEKWVPEALAVSNIDRATHESYEDPQVVMQRFVKWVESVSVGKPIFVSDNPAFDYQFMNYYLIAYTGNNPFGHSARRIGDIYSGLVKDLRASSAWKKWRKTKHTHNPVDDARGNAEALLVMADKYGLKI